MVFVVDELQGEMRVYLSSIYTCKMRDVQTFFTEHFQAV